ncbi:MAG: DUF4446 family protein, partial [Patescibacteria group bacterium]
MKIEIYLILIAIVLVAGIFWIFFTERRLKRFFLGKKAKDLEEYMNILQKDIVFLKTEKENMKKEINLINQKVKKSIRGLEMIRFNPFSDQGSNQSFAISMLNEDGDGLILSSLYSRERISVFAKPIKNKKSEY